MRRCLLPLCVLVGCALAEEVPLPALPVVLTADFEDGRFEGWTPTDPNAWRFEEVEGVGRVLSLYRQSKYAPKVRSPLNIILRDGLVLGDFVLDVKMRSTTRDYGHRDMCVFFGHQDTSHYYYVHIANNSDPHANSIFKVDGAPRVSIAAKRTEGTKWDDKWHRVRVVRQVAEGTILVYFDDMSKPIMEAQDTTFTWGGIGLGTFDDTGLYDDLQVRGQIVERPAG